MEIWILIFPLLAIFWLGAAAIEIYENWKFNQIMRQRHMKELKRAVREWEKKNYYTAAEIKKLLELEERAKPFPHKTSGVKTTLTTGEEQVLGPGTIYFGGIDNEAEKLIKEARDKKID